MRFFTPSHPAGRLEYLAIMVLLNVAMYYATQILLNIVVIDPIARDFTYNQGNLSWFFFTIGILFAFQMITVLRRLHDLHMSGMAALLLFVPVVGLFFQLFLLLSSGISRSTAAPFGDNPYDPDSWVAKPAPGTSTGPSVTFRGEALSLPGEESWGQSDAA